MRKEGQMQTVGEQVVEGGSQEGGGGKLKTLGSRRQVPAPAYQMHIAWQRPGEIRNSCTVAVL